MNLNKSGGSDEVKSARRALMVLELLTAMEAGLTFTEIHKALELPRSSMSGLLRTLVESGWARYQSETRRYTLGIRTLQAGNAYSRSFDLVDRAKPVMIEIRDRTEETVQLAVLDGRYNVYLAKVDGFQLLRLASEVGRALPAHATALGKVLLAGLAPTACDELLANVRLERLTDRTITNQAVLMQELAEIRRVGYGLDSEEYTLGLRCIAVPIHDARAATVAAMSVSVPTIRFDRTQADRALAALLNGAERLSSALGFTGRGKGSTQRVTTERFD
jgi:DNA-binding IclR family transcriptional regulator